MGRFRILICERIVERWKQRSGLVHRFVNFGKELVIIAAIL